MTSPLNDVRFGPVYENRLRTPRLSITPDEFAQCKAKLKGAIAQEYGDPIDHYQIPFCQWIIEKVADGTILVEEP